MVYRDSNNIIMIDDVAANDDISKLSSSKTKLEQVLKNLDLIDSLNSEMSGEVTQSIAESIIRLRAKVSKQIEAIDDTISDIQAALSKYRTIDESSSSAVNTLI